MSDPPRGSRTPVSDRIEAQRISSWDYRVVRRSDEATNDESYEIIEAYYDGDGNLTAWCPATPAGNNVQELYDDLNRMIEAVGRAFLRSPALAPIEYADLPSERR